MFVPNLYQFDPQYHIMIKAEHDLTIQHNIQPSSNTKSISIHSDRQRAHKFKKLQRKRSHSNSQRSFNYKINRDFQVVYFRNQKPAQKEKARILLLALTKIIKRMTNLAYQNLKKVWIFQQQSFRQQDLLKIVTTANIKKNQLIKEGLYDLQDVFKSKSQLFLVFGFIKISYQQKQIIKKRQWLQNILEKKKIQNVFNILNNLLTQKCSKTNQVGNNVRDPSNPVISKIDSSTTLGLSALQTNRSQYKTPFWNTKTNKTNRSSNNLQQSQISQDKQEGLDSKLYKLDTLLQEAKSIRDNYSFSKKQNKSGFENNLKHASSERRICNLYNIKISPSEHEFCKKINQDISKQNYRNKTSTSQIPKYGRMQSNTQEKNTNKKSNTKQKIHNIIQPVIHQVVQPIHYQIFMGEGNYYFGSNVFGVNYSPQIVYRPIFQHQPTQFPKGFSLQFKNNRTYQ